MEEANSIFLPVMEGAVVIAAEYCKACGRKQVGPRDIEMGLKYCARNLLGKQIGTMFPEIYDNDDEDSCDDIEDGEEEEWSRYEGSDEKMQAVNACYDTWDEWVPETPAEIACHGAIQKVET